MMKTSVRFPDTFGGSTTRAFFSLENHRINSARHDQTAGWTVVSICPAGLREILLLLASRAQWNSKSHIAWKVMNS